MPHSRLHGFVYFLTIVYYSTFFIDPLLAKALIQLTHLWYIAKNILS